MKPGNSYHFLAEVLDLGDKELRVCVNGESEPIDLYNGFHWSPRLVPVDEVEKAYKEAAHGSQLIMDWWNESRAKQVVEGEIVEEKGAK